jgi:hypothetical protein
MTRRVLRATLLRAGLAAALAGAAVGAAPAGATPLDAPPALVISGSGPAAATFRVAQPTRIDLLEASLRMTGTYGGVLIRSARGVTYGGLLRVTALDTGVDAQPVVRQAPVLLRGIGGPRPVLAPGTYTAYLLSDGTSDVTIPLLSGHSLTVHPSLRRTTQVLRTTSQDLPPNADDAVDHVVVRQSVTRPENAYSVLIGQVVAGTVATEPAVQSCYSRDSACRATEPGAPGTSIAGTSALEQATALSPLPHSGGRWWSIVDVATRKAAGGGLVRTAFFQIEF